MLTFTGVFFLYNALKILIVANIPVPVSPKVGPGFKGMQSAFPVMLMVPPVA
jgi:hypothetical protein